MASTWQASEICKFLLERKGCLSPQQLAQKLVSRTDYDIQQCGSDDKQTAQQAINALTLIYREAVRSKCHANEFETILSSVSSLNSSSCGILARVWSNHSTSLLSSSKVWISNTKSLYTLTYLVPCGWQVKSILSIGRLTGFEWKFGVSTESSRSRWCMFHRRLMDETNV